MSVGYILKNCALINPLVTTILSLFLQDLLSEALDDKIESLEEVEAAHYLYPVDVKAVLTNEDLRTVVCRNF